MSAQQMQQPSSAMDLTASKEGRCAACLETIAGLAVELACSHVYCVPCIVELFKEAVLHESSYPPTCCGRDGVPLELARPYLSDELIEGFEDRAVEFETVDRTYCSACSAFVRPRHVTNGQAICPKCTASTCSQCKMQIHSGACKEKNDQLLLRLAERKGWRRCPRCRRMVEKGPGCNVIDCYCGAEFCYACGEDMTKCACTDVFVPREANFVEDEWTP